MERWFSKHLRAMGEPSLLEAAQDKNRVEYRFLWLRTFHHPIAVRVSLRSSGDASLSGIETDGKGGYGPGRTLHNQTFELSTEQAAALSQLLEKARFWDLETPERTITRRDGAEWIVEGVRSGKYHVVVRWGPEGGDYRDLCLKFLSLSRIDLERIY